MGAMGPPALVLLLAAALPQAPPRIGEAAPPLGFTDVRGLERSIDELGPGRATVLVFATVECPLARRSLPALGDLARDFEPEGVRFLLLVPEDRAGLGEIASLGLRSGLPFPAGKDRGGRAARALGVTRSPTAVLLDAAGRLRYRGRVDGRFRLGGARPGPVREDLRLALQAVLEGREPEVAETPAEGCLLAFETPPVPDPPPTWAGEVAALLDRHCLDCHRKGGGAPFSLEDPGKAQRFAPMIAEVVQDRRMPPWLGSPDSADFRGRRWLEDGEIQTLVDWARAGAPLGDLETAPAPQERPDRDWRIRPPDLVTAVAAEEVIPARGVLPYRYRPLPVAFPEETWVQEIEIRNRVPEVLHHANLAWIEPGLEMEPHFITGLVPGGDPMALPDGVAVRIPAGAILILQCHYVTLGEEVRDRIEVGFRYPRTTVHQELRHWQIGSWNFRIEPGEDFQEVRAARAFRRPVRGLGLFAHMHYRGQAMRFDRLRPGGARELLLEVPIYSFDWQQAYPWAEPPRFEPGETLEVTAWFDNSSFNPWNPDPERTVGFGLQSTDEMMIGFFFFVREGEDLALEVDPADGTVVPVVE